MAPPLIKCTSNRVHSYWVETFSFSVALMYCMHVQSYGGDLYVESWRWRWTLEESCWSDWENLLLSGSHVGTTVEKEDTHIWNCVKLDKNSCDWSSCGKTFKLGPSGDGELTPRDPLLEFWPKCGKRVVDKDWFCTFVILQELWGTVDKGIRSNPFVSLPDSFECMEYI